MRSRGDPGAGVCVVCPSAQRPCHLRRSECGAFPAVLAFAKAVPGACPLSPRLGREQGDSWSASRALGWLAPRGSREPLSYSPCCRARTSSEVGQNVLLNLFPPC